MFKLIIVAAVLLSVIGCSNSSVTTVKQCDVCITGKFVKWDGFYNYANIVITADDDTVFDSVDNIARISSIKCDDDMYRVITTAPEGAKMVASVWFTGDSVVTAECVVSDSVVLVVK